MFQREVRDRKRGGKKWETSASLLKIAAEGVSANVLR